ncbi:MAG TPA: methionine--tRNA ligase [Fimbriimonadales bacterium]|nr:methionine--tRNA ligase [Fimbriimonadales bacterium]
MPKRYYITTPIYYVNSVPHIGTALTTLAADITARYQEMRGKQVHFLTGTDENATKVAEAAQAAGKAPKEFVDEISQEFVRIWKRMNIRYHDFIRTTEPRHTRVVQEVFRRLLEGGHIYEDEYKGWYDVSSETFYKESELVDGKSPEGNPVRWVEEKNYFFRLSAFGERLLKHIEENPKFILPEVRRNEVVAFIKPGLHDICVSRRNTGWGIPVPGDESRVIYVWIDALINYISAIGWPDGNWQEYWPADVEWMGKDILVRFHATIWPAMLMALEMELPKTLVGHGWMLIGEEKISKSRGNVIPPLELAEEVSSRTGVSEELAVDVVRYYMARTMPFETDSKFTYEDFDSKYNSEIVNDFSNGIHRVTSMLNNFCDGEIPDAPLIEKIVEEVRDVLRSYEMAMEEFRIDNAVECIRALAAQLNMAIDQEKPWDLRKNKDPRFGSVMRTLAWMVRMLEGLLRPITPSFSDRIAGLLALPAVTKWEDIGGAHSVPSSHKIAKAEPIYPRLETSKPSFAKSETKKETQEKAMSETITFEEFSKVKLQIARVLDAHKVEGADKLLRLELAVGDEKRQVVAGIANEYSPEDLIGRQVVLVANLEPRKLRGIESQGMILAADGPNGEAILIQPDKEAPDGARVH